MLVEELQALLNGLQDRDPQIVRLCLEGYSANEIADDMKCSYSTVRRVLKRVAVQIRAKIQKNSND